MMNTLRVLSASICVLTVAGCVSGQIRGVTSEARGHAQSGNLAALEELMDAQTPEVQEQVFADAPEARRAYNTWKTMTPEEQEGRQKAYAMTDESLPAPVPEAVFVEPQAEVQAKIIELCATSNLAVLEANPNMVVCEGNAGLGNALAHALFTPAYSSAAKENIRFVIYTSGGQTKVRASAWIQSQSAFGQVNRTEMSAPAHMRALRQILVRAGGQ